MKQKEKLIEVLKEELTLKDIYQKMPETKKESIRGCLNNGVKKGIFEKTGVGKYKSKE